MKLEQQRLLRIDWWLFARGVFCMCAWIFPTEVGSGITVYTSAVHNQEVQRCCLSYVFATLSEVGRTCGFIFTAINRLHTATHCLLYLLTLIISHIFFKTSVSLFLPCVHKICNDSHIVPGGTVRRIRSINVLFMIYPTWRLCVFVYLCLCVGLPVSGIVYGI